MKLRALGIIMSLGLVAALGVAGTASARGREGVGGKLTATLTGVNEVPGPGDPDGSGSATITLDRTHNQVCFTIHVSGVTLPATGAHIHQGAQGVAGPIVVTLSPPDTTGSSSGCVAVTPDLLNAILANASGYYVNVHTVDFPNGALRGQLSGHGNGGGNDGDDEHHGDGDDHHGGGDHHHGGGHHHHGGGDAHGVRVGA